MWSLRNESEVAWNEFFDMLLKVYGDRLDVPENVTIFDRQKGLESALARSMRDMVGFNCVKHMEGNVITNVDLGSVEPFRRLAYAPTKEQFEYHWSQSPPKLRAYLQKIPRTKWAKAYCPAELGGSMASQVTPS